MIEGVLLDLSGVLYVGDQPLEGAHGALAKLQAAPVPVRFVTNTTRSPAAAILRQLSTMGFTVPEEQLYTAPMAAREYLQAHRLRPFPLIHPDLAPEFDSLAGATPAVLLGDAGGAFTYEALNRAFRLLMAGAPLVAMGRNRYFKQADGLSLDAGPFIAALEYAADVTAVITGKPAAAFFHAACAALGTAPECTVMVGDDVEGDVNGATAAGLQGVLVRTGKYRAGDEQRLQSPSAVVVPDLAAAVDWIAGAAE